MFCSQIYAQNVDNGAALSVYHRHLRGWREVVRVASRALFRAPSGPEWKSDTQVRCVRFASPGAHTCSRCMQGLRALQRTLFPDATSGRKRQAETAAAAPTATRPHFSSSATDDHSNAERASTAASGRAAATFAPPVPDGAAPSVRD